MEWLLPLIGGLGIGSLFTSIFNHHVTRKATKDDRLYQEKRESYLGLLNALHRAAVFPSDENSKGFALWQTQCELFGAPEVAQHIKAIVDTNDGPHSARQQAFEALIQAMRADLRR